MPRTLGQGKVRAVELLYYVRMFASILFLFFVDSELGDLELTPRTLGKGKCEGGEVVCCLLIM